MHQSRLGADLLERSSKRKTWVSWWTAENGRQKCCACSFLMLIWYFWEQGLPPLTMAVQLRAEISVLRSRECSRCRQFYFLSHCSCLPIVKECFHYTVAVVRHYLGLTASAPAHYSRHTDRFLLISTSCSSEIQSCSMRRGQTSERNGLCARGVWDCCHRDSKGRWDCEGILCVCMLVCCLTVHALQFQLNRNPLEAKTVTQDCKILMVFCLCWWGVRATKSPWKLAEKL